MRLIITGSHGQLKRDRILGNDWLVRFTSGLNGEVTIQVTQARALGDGRGELIKEEDPETFYQDEYGQIRLLDDQGENILSMPPVRLGPKELLEEEFDES